MKKMLPALLLFLPLFSRAQTILVRIGSDTLHNPIWNNWNTWGKSNDTSGTFRDIAQYKTTVRAVLGNSGTRFDNGAGYLAGKSILPDTVIRRGISNGGIIYFSLLGLNNGSSYTVTFYASRNLLSGQKTIFSINRDSVTIPTDTNAIRTAVLPNLVPTKGELDFYVQNQPTSYLNAFRIEATPPQQLFAKINIDSTTIHSPNSLVHVNTDSSYEKGSHIAAVQWWEVSGPTTAIFTPVNAAGSQVIISGLFPGTYQFETLVNDTLANTASALVTVTVSPLIIPPCPVCLPPVICPPKRTVTGVSWTLAAGVWVPVFTYSDGTHL